MRKKPEGCAGCPLERTGRGFVRPVKEDKKYMLLVQGEAPGSEEIAEGRPFVGQAGKTLRLLVLPFAGVTADQVFFDNTLRCLPPSNAMGEAYPTGESRKRAEQHCRQYDVWDEFPKDVPLLCVGGKAQEMWFPGKNISDIHGHIEIRNGRAIGCTFHPSFVNRTSLNVLPLVIAEVRNLLEAAKRPELLRRPDVVKGHIPYSHGSPCAFDLEWNEVGTVTVVGVAYDASVGFSTFDVQDGLDIIRQHMEEGTQVIGHNIIDADLQKVDAKPKSWRPEHVFDTKIAAHLVHAHLASMGLLNLGSLVRFYFPTSDWKQDKSDVLVYNAYDVAYTFKLFQALCDDLRMTGQWHLMEKQQTLAQMAALMHKQGVRVDAARVTEYVTKRREQLAELVKDLPINPNSPKQIVEWARDLGISLPDATFETLEKYQGVNPAFDKLIAYRAEAKSIKTWFPYEEDKNGNLVWVAEQVFPHFNVTGTDVARFSCSEPNFQNLPKPLRRMIIAPSGFELAAFDAEQIENRCVAWLARDEQMLADFASGLDVHRLVASRIFGKRYEEVTDTERFEGKRTVHASNYGETKFNLANRLFGNRKKESVAAADRLQQAYFAAYPRVRAWQMEVSQQLDRGDVRLRNPFGRLRFVYAHSSHERMKRGCHFLGCSTAADIVNGKAIAVWQELGLLPMLIVHDELVYVVPEGDMDTLKKIVEILESPVQEMAGFRIPWKCSVGRNYGPADDSNPDGLRVVRLR